MTRSSTHAPTRWLRRFRPAASPRLRLMCLPHAGGAPSFFRSWAGLVPADVEVVSLCYPGRQDRLGEPCIERMDQLVDQVVNALLPLADRPLALFGHSMGSAVAYEAALRLEGRHGVPVEVLLVSGRAAPHCARGTGLHLLDDDGLLEGAAALGGLDLPGLIESGLRDLVLPALRADFRLTEEYRCEPGTRVRAPIVAYHGETDARSTVQEVREWAALTDGGFELRLFPGGHFYLADAEAELVSDITRRLATL